MALRGTTPISSRSLALTVTTSNCGNVRSQPYRNRMELVYDYLIEYDDLDGRQPDLIGIESAISYGIAGALKTCDAEGSPLYAVELGSGHQVSKEGYCVPLDPANKCKVIRGVTGIRFDNNASDVQLLAYDAIEGVLAEPDFLGQFVTMSYDRLDFVQMKSNSISPTAGRTNEDSSGSRVAIAAGTVSFVLAAIFVGGLFRKNRQKKARIKKQLEPGKGKRFLLGSAPRKYYELDEEQETGTGFKMLGIAAGETYYENPSITWSISDITSESGSIRSNVSRTTSKLERIEEVEEEYPTDDEWDGTDTHACSGHMDSISMAEYLYDTSSPRHHVGQWDTVVEESTEPEGCRYIDDSSSSDPDDEAPGLMGLSEIENYLLECSDDSDDDDLGDELPEDLTEVDKYLVPVLSDDDSVDYDEEEAEDEIALSETILNTSVDTGASNETRAVLHQSARDWDEVSDTSASKWMIELLKELRKSQRRKLLTYGDDIETHVVPE